MDEQLETTEYIGIIEQDVDKSGLFSLVTAEQDIDGNNFRWFSMPVPPEVICNTYLAMQAELRDIAERYGVAEWVRANNEPTP